MSGQAAEVTLQARWFRGEKLAKLGEFAAEKA